MRADGTILSGGRDGTVRRWSKDGKPIGRPLSGKRKGIVRNVGFGPDGSFVAAVFVSSGREISLRRWNSNEASSSILLKLTQSGDGTSTSRIRFARSRARVIQFATDESSVAATSDGRILRWDKEGNKQAPEFRVDSRFVGPLAVGPDGSILYVDRKRQVHRWDRNGKPIGKPTSLEGVGRITAVAVGPDGRVVAGHLNGTISQWDRGLKQLNPTIKKGFIPYRGCEAPGRRGIPVCGSKR